MIQRAPVANSSYVREGRDKHMVMPPPTKLYEQMTNYLYPCVEARDVLECVKSLPLGHWVVVLRSYAYEGAPECPTALRLPGRGTRSRGLSRTQGQGERQGGETAHVGVEGYGFMMLSGSLFGVLIKDVCFWVPWSVSNEAGRSCGGRFEPGRIASFFPSRKLGSLVFLQEGFRRLFIGGLVSGALSDVLAPCPGSCCVVSPRQGLRSGTLPHGLCAGFGMACQVSCSPRRSNVYTDGLFA